MVECSSHACISHPFSVSHYIEAGLVENKVSLAYQLFINTVHVNGRTECVLADRGFAESIEFYVLLLYIMFLGCARVELSLYSGRSQLG